MRGGPRPGAGAPRGNTNALKSGRRSRLFRPAYGALGPLGTYALVRAVAAVRLHGIIEAMLVASTPRSLDFLLRSSRVLAPGRVLAHLQAIDWTADPETIDREVATALLPLLRPADQDRLRALMTRQQSMGSDDGHTLNQSDASSTDVSRETPVGGQNRESTVAPPHEGAGG